MSRARVRGHHGRHGSRERPLTGHGPGFGRAGPAKAASSRESPSTGKRHAVGKVPQLAVGNVPQLANGSGVGRLPLVLVWAASSRERPSTGKRHGSRERSLNWQSGKSLNWLRIGRWPPPVGVGEGSKQSGKSLNWQAAWQSG